MVARMETAVAELERPSMTVNAMLRRVAGIAYRSRNTSTVRQRQSKVSMLTSNVMIETIAVGTWIGMHRNVHLRPQQSPILQPWLRYPIAAYSSSVACIEFLYVFWVLNFI